MTSSVPDSPPSGDRLLTTHDVARMLHVSPRTLERLRNNGTGPEFIKVGPGLRSPVRYRESDVIAYLERYKFSSTSDYDPPHGLN